MQVYSSLCTQQLHEFVSLSEFVLFLLYQDIRQVIVKCRKMGRGLDLKKSEKERIVQELGLGKDTLEISKLLHRDHRIIQKFVNEGKMERKKRPTGNFTSLTSRDINSIKRELSRNPHMSSNEIFLAAGLPNVPKNTRCRVLRSLGRVKTMEKRPLLTQKHKEKRLDWAQAYMKQDFSKVLFTD